MRDIRDGWMRVKRIVAKEGTVTLHEIAGLDIFDFFILLNQIQEEQQAKR